MLCRHLSSGLQPQVDHYLSFGWGFFSYISDDLYYFFLIVQQSIRGRTQSGSAQIPRPEPAPRGEQHADAHDEGPD